MPKKTNYDDLFKVLNKHKRTSLLLQAIDYNNLRENDKAIIDQIDKISQKYLIKNKKLLAKWAAFKGDIYDRIINGAESRKNLIIAMILAGAAISDKNANNLRKQFKHFLPLRLAYLNDLNKNINPLFKTSPFYKSLKYSVTIVKTINIYEKLISNSNGEGKFKTAVNKILNDDSIKLRLGSKLNSLDLGEIDKLQNEYFLPPYKISILGKELQGTQQEPIEEEAPTKTKLILDSYTCYKKGERSGDDIFWTTNLLKLKNPKFVYDQIDYAITHEKPLDNLKIEWDIVKWQQSELVNNVKEDKEYLINKEAFELRIYKGFAPWRLIINCIDDDDAEYDAIKETIDTVGDIAEIVGQTASLVALVNPTVVGAGAAVIASAAEIVDVVCDVTSGIISIVNYFDENDNIGTIIIDGPEGEYSSYFPPHDLKTYDEIKNGHGGPHYQLATRELTSEPEKVERTWRIEIGTKHGTTFKKDPWGFHGGNGEVWEVIDLGKQVDQLRPDIPDSDVDVPGEGKGKYKHAEYRTKPFFPKLKNNTILKLDNGKYLLNPAALRSNMSIYLKIQSEMIRGSQEEAQKLLEAFYKDNRRFVKCEIHWGCTGHRSVTFTPYVGYLDYVQKM